MAIVFTGDEYGEGGAFIHEVLKQQNVRSSFFFTGRFYRNKTWRAIIQKLKNDGHYLGAHSDQHLLYCDWIHRDSQLVSKQEFNTDLLNNYKAMWQVGIERAASPFFLPPYEWYNDSISKWTSELDLQLINYTPVTLSHADYTTPDEKNYRNAETIFQSIISYEQQAASGLNGFILLMHIGTDAKRTDKFYKRLPQLIQYLKQKNYSLVRVDELLYSHSHTDYRTD